MAVVIAYMPTLCVVRCSLTSIGAKRYDRRVELFWYYCRYYVRLLLFDCHCARRPQYCVKTVTLDIYCRAAVTSTNELAVWSMCYYMNRRCRLSCRSQIGCQRSRAGELETDRVDIADKSSWMYNIRFRALSPRVVMTNQWIYDATLGPVHRCCCCFYCCCCCCCCATSIMYMWCTLWMLQSR